MFKSSLKITAKGSYSHFPGVTVIAKVQNKDLDFCKKIYACLVESELITQYYSPLPFESYHMTTNNLFTAKKDGGDDWEAFINQNLTIFQRLHYYLKANAFNPQITITTTIVEGVIQLIGELPKDQIVIINAFASEFDLRDRIPSVFHITLAYQYKNIPIEALNAIKKQLTEKLKHILTSQPLQLNPPQLCYFNDMTAFITWDGSSSPFIKDNQSSVSMNNN